MIASSVRPSAAPQPRHAGQGGETVKRGGALGTGTGLACATWDKYRCTAPLADYSPLMQAKTHREQGLAVDGASELGYIDIINRLIDES